MDIDAMIADVIQTSDSAQPQADATTEAPIETIETPEVEPSETVETAENNEDLFPKKAINALSKRDRQIGKLRAQQEQVIAENKALREQLANGASKPVVNDGEPRVEDFANFIDYTRAINKYDNEQSYKARETAQQQTQQVSQDQQWKAQREQTVAKQAAEFAASNPEAKTVFDDNSDILDDFSPDLQRLLLEADNTAQAVFNLAKEGKLEGLANLSLARAAMEIGRAQSATPTRQQSKAPTPLPASRGSVTGGKSLADITTDQDALMKWLKT